MGELTNDEARKLGKALDATPEEKDALTPRERLFVDNYIVTRNPRSAAVAAGFAEKSARGTACRILKRAHVRAAIDKRLSKEVQRFRLEADCVKKMLEDAATLDLTELIEIGAKGVELKDFKAIPKHLRVLITEITNTPTKTGTKVNFKVFSKEKAVEMLARIFGLDKGSSVQVNVQVNNLAQAIDAYEV